MTTKQYLTQALVLDRKINTKLAEYTKLKKLAYCVNSISNGEKVQSSHENNSNKNIDKLIDLSREIDVDVGILLDIQKDIKSTINKLTDNKYRLVLINRYVNCLSFEQCAIVLNYDIRHIYRLHKEALKIIKNVIECQYKSVI